MKTASPRFLQEWRVYKRRRPDSPLEVSALLSPERTVAAAPKELCAGPRVLECAVVARHHQQRVCVQPGLPEDGREVAHHVVHGRDRGQEGAPLGVRHVRVQGRVGGGRLHGEVRLRQGQVQEQRGGGRGGGVVEEEAGHPLLVQVLEARGVGCITISAWINNLDWFLTF